MKIKDEQRTLTEILADIEGTVVKIDCGESVEHPDFSYSFGGKGCNMPVAIEQELREWFRDWNSFRDGEQWDHFFEIGENNIYHSYFYELVATEIGEEMLPFD